MTHQFIIDASESQELTRIIATQDISLREAQGLVKTLVQWEQHKGIRWVVARLKSLRSAFISGDFSGFALDKRGRLKHGFGPLQRLATSRRGSIRVDRILRIYGRWEEREVGLSSYQAFAMQVNPQTVSVPDDKLVLKPSRRDRALAYRISREADFDLELPLSKVKKVPFNKGASEAETDPSTHLKLLLTHCPVLAQRHHKIFDKVFAVDWFNGATWDSSQEDPGNDTWPVTDRPPIDIVGKVVGLTKDGGLKTRFIANPHRFIQLALTRLQNASAGYLKRMPESLVYDQQAGIEWIVNALREGKSVSSIDLSSATDFFPLWLQERLVRVLFPTLAEDIDLWVDVSRNLWATPVRAYVRYGQGQPMGVAPSFSIFTLTHIHLIRALGGNTSNFRVVGDDVVITDPLVTEAYTQVMKQLGVQISISKSLFNRGDRAEFVGRVVDKVGAWPSFKGRKLDLSRDPMGPLRQYGISAAGLLPSVKREVMVFVAQVPLLGPEHLNQLQFLDEVDSKAYYESCRERVATSYPPRRAVPAMVRNSDSFLTCFEEVNPMGSFRGKMGSVNDPLLTDHVNCNLRYPSEDSGLFVQDLERFLEKGKSPVEFYGLEPQVPNPWRYYKKLYRALTSAIRS